MNEEEKKAIELLKKLQKKTPYIIWGDGTPYNKSNQIQTILNLIEKLQKELKAEKEKNKGLIDNSNKLIEVTNLYLDSVPKSKIREIFDNYSQSSLMENNTFLEFKKELLEE